MNMKKLFAVLTTAIILAACNDTGDTSTEIIIDSSNTESPLMDAVNTSDSARKAMEAAKDSGNKVIDSVNEKNN